MFFPRAGTGPHFNSRVFTAPKTSGIRGVAGERDRQTVLWEPAGAGCRLSGSIRQSEGRIHPGRTAQCTAVSACPTLPRMPVPIRDVESRDIDRIRSLNDDAVPTVNVLTNADLDWFASHAHYFRVVIDAHGADRPAAFLVGLRPGLDYASENYRWFSRNYRDFAYVDRVVVDPQARRSGFASLLYEDFRLSLPDELAVMTCEVNLRPPNPASLRFHERLGFRQVGTQETDGGAKRVALMEKRL